MQWTRGARLAVGLWLGVACSDEEPRPPLAVGCDDPGCIEIQGMSQIGGGIGVGQAGSGSSGAAGSAGMGVVASGVLAGSVRAIIEPDLGLGSLDSPVEVRSNTPAGVSVAAEVASDGSFRLQGVDPNPALWVGVGSFDDDPVSPFMDTLQSVDASAEAFVDLRVMRRSVMEELAAQSFLAEPVELAANRAHGIVGFEDANGTPLAGVQVALRANPEASVAYDVGAIYSDLTEETGGRGTVALVNLLASAYPGNAVPLTAQLRGQELDLSLRFAAGAVTVIAIVVE